MSTDSNGDIDDNMSFKSSNSVDLNAICDMIDRHNQEHELVFIKIKILFSVMIRLLEGHIKKNDLIDLKTRLDNLIKNQ
jgi:hypothetical protein